MGPLVSVIVPIYNTESTLRKCVNSVLGQKYNQLELILIDDGSTDGSSGICMELLAMDSRVRYFHQLNSGASIARNKGLDMSTGEWIMFLDSDDWIDSEMLDRMLTMTDNSPEIDIIQSSVPRDNGEPVRTGLFTSSEAIQKLLEGLWWTPCCKLIRRSSIGDIRFPERTICEDYYFNYHLFSNISHLFFFDECFYHRSDRIGSLSRLGLSERKFDEFYNVLSVHNAVVQDYPQYKRLSECHLAGSCLKLLFLILNNNAQKEYADQLGALLGTIKSYYLSFMINSFIPRNQRILLSTCFSRSSARITEKVFRMFNSIEH